MEGLSEIGRVPEDCVSRVLSLTTPRDSCRSAAVSAAFRRAADSDDVWSQFLPSDYREILSRAVDPPPVFSSLKELYFLLCDPILIDGGRKIFSLEKESGAKCYTLCVSDLGIVWGGDRRYWRWYSHPDSRFAQVAELKQVWWLDICGKIDCRELSPHTTYSAYLIFKLCPQSFGLNFPAQQASVTVGAQTSEQDVCLNPEEEEMRASRARSDGWMEMELGEFFSGDGSEGEVIMRLREVEFLNMKRGLVVEGIQVRPK